MSALTKRLSHHGQVGRAAPARSVTGTQLKTADALASPCPSSHARKAPDTLGEATDTRQGFAADAFPPKFRCAAPTAIQPPFQASSPAQWPILVTKFTC